MNHEKKCPEFIVFTGCMFSSKTSRLLSMLERYRYQHRPVMVFKPRKDDRYSSSDVVTHSGWRTHAHAVTNGADILDAVSDAVDGADVIAVDEAFMIPGVSEALVFLFRRGFTIIVSSLDMSSSAKPFAEVEKMLPWATRVEKCTAVCTVCGKDAHYTHRKCVDDIDEIKVGGSETYEPRCALHHPAVLQHVLSSDVGRSVDGLRQIDRQEITRTR